MCTIRYHWAWTCIVWKETRQFASAPFHGDHRPSASFNVITGLFHCFACGASSNAKHLAQELGGEVVAVESIAIKRSKEKEEWENLLTAPIAYDNWYLKSRDVPNDVAASLELRELPNGIAFINYDLRGRAVGAQVRQYSGTPRYLFYGDRTPLWPMSMVHGKDSDPICIVEGVFGVLRGIQAGKRVVATMGAGSLHNVAKILNGQPKIVIFDNDFAGHLGAAKLLSLGGFAAIVPGLEADELPVDEWKRIALTHFITSNMNDFLHLDLANYDKMLKLVRKFRS
jgi:hypothetical protein